MVGQDLDNIQETLEKMELYEELKEALREKIEEHDLSGKNISVRCKVLSAVEAIGNPEHDDYPIIKGKEVMVEALFQGAKGQAFTDTFENADYLVDDLLEIDLSSNKGRASFIAGLNAVFRYLELCDKTIHCKDSEPKECAKHLPEFVGDYEKVLLVGQQPRFLEALAAHYDLRVVDMDQDNIGREISGIKIESPEMTADAIEWCNLIFATGSTVVNGTMAKFLAQNKPIIFYGVTGSATAKILNLKKYCYSAH